MKEKRSRTVFYPLLPHPQRLHSCWVSLRESAPPVMKDDHLLPLQVPSWGLVINDWGLVVGRKRLSFFRCVPEFKESLAS